MRCSVNMNSAQQYCLRWNNHRTNLLRVFEELLQNESFTDVTIVCEGGDQIKCHKVVLAACSPYFQDLFTNIPCKHPIVVLKDVKYFEIKAILEYMYRGEVNVAQNQLAVLLKVAEALKVKGLVEENRPGETIKRERDDSPSSASPQNLKNIVHSSSSLSPPHSTSNMYKNPYMYPKPSSSDRNDINLPLWAVPGLPIHSSTPHSASSISPNGHSNSGPSTTMSVNNCYDQPSGTTEIYPHRKKKFSSMMMSKDTPILRTVLGQGQADSSQPVSLVCHADSRDQELNDHEPYKKHLKNEPLEDAQSPYTDFTMVNDEDIKPKMAIPSSSPQSFSSDLRSPGIATYVPTQKPEWKRYKQYTRNDIMSAIDAVRNGMSALQAARKYGVPSRTLYDKVKKLGITTSRPFKRGSNGSSACFPYMLSNQAPGSPYNMSENEEGSLNNNSSILEASSFLQHALDNRGEDALTAMAVAAAQHALESREEARTAMTIAAAKLASSSHRSSSPTNHHLASSPSPSPTLLKYMAHRLTPNRMTPSPTSDNHLSETNGSSERDTNYEDDQVEDLSISRKPLEQGVIIPPMNQVSTIMKKDDVLKDIKEDTRRELAVDEAE